MAMISPTRLADLKPFEYFCVGETGFGTGLNILGPVAALATGTSG